MYAVAKYADWHAAATNESPKPTCTLADTTINSGLRFLTAQLISFSALLQYTIPYNNILHCLTWTNLLMAWVSRFADLMGWDLMQIYLLSYRRVAERVSVSDTVRDEDSRCFSEHNDQASAKLSRWFVLSINLAINEP